MDFQIIYEYNYSSSTWYDRPYSTIEVEFPPTSVPESLLTEYDGDPWSSLRIDAEAFNDLPICYTLDDVTVTIDVSKDFNGDGVKTKYMTGTKTLSDIYYYDYPVVGGVRQMIVHVDMQRLQNPR